MTSFKLNYADAFRSLRHDSAFTDVFLTCGQNVIPAHRIILSSCSRYFKRVLYQTSQVCVTNYCVLDGCSESLLATVIQFIYAGVVEIAADSVEPFVLLCKKLEIVGFDDDEQREFDASLDALSDEFAEDSSEDEVALPSRGEVQSVKEEYDGGSDLDGDDEAEEGEPEVRRNGDEEEDPGVDVEEAEADTVMVQELDPYRDMPLLRPSSVNSLDEKDFPAENGEMEEEEEDGDAIDVLDDPGPSSSSLVSENASSDSSVDDPYRTQCARCLKQFTTAYTRMQHEKYNCSTLSPEERRQNKAKNSCPRCGNGFLTPKLLRKHLRQNACVGRGGCGGGGFPRPFTMSEKPHHWGKPPPDEEIQREVAINIIKVGNRDDGFRWKCGFCGKKYCASWVCKNHIEIAHMKEPQVFGCSTCGAKFRWKSSLNKHRRETCPAKVRSLGVVASGSGVDPAQALYPCSKCSLTFRWKFALDKHQARCCHGGSAESKAFPCRKCGRRCLSKVGLKQHEKYFCSVAQSPILRSAVTAGSGKSSDKAQAPTPDLLPIAGAKLTVTKTAPMPGQQGASMINMKLEKDRVAKKPQLLVLPSSPSFQMAVPTPVVPASPAAAASASGSGLSPAAPAAVVVSLPPPTPPLLPVSDMLLNLAGTSPSPAPTTSSLPPPPPLPPADDAKPLEADGVVSKERVEGFIIKLSTADERRWQCRECRFVFKSKYTLEQHIETQHLHVKFSCKYCQSTYTRRYNLLNHQVTCRANQAAGVD